MTDKEKEKPVAEHKHAAGRSFAQILFDEFVVSILVLKGGPWLWDTFKKFLDKNADAHMDKPNLMAIFAQAMNKLKADDPPACDTLEHFMAATDGLNNDPTDLEDFQLRSAAIGGAEIEPTVLFLKRVAEPSRHSERRAFLGRYGIIGSRAVDAHEKVVNLITDTKKAIVSAAKIAGIAIVATPVLVDALLSKKIDSFGASTATKDSAARTTVNAELQKRLDALKK